MKNTPPEKRSGRDRRRLPRLCFGSQKPGRRREDFQFSTDLLLEKYRC